MSEPTAGRNKDAGAQSQAPQRRSPFVGYAIPVVVFAILAAFFLVGLNLDSGDIVESPLLGTKAPAFTLPSLTDPDATVGTEDLAGRYTLLNTWATWCVTCREEHGFLMTLASEGVPIYGLNWKEKNGRADALQWLETLGDPYVASAFDEEGDVGIEWGIYLAPETFLVAPDLTILHKHAGAMTREVWTRDFLPAIDAHRGQR